MNFTTKIPIPNSSNPIDYASKIVSLGSCFAENMGVKLEYFKFQNSVNPFGIIFNPISIENLINRAVNKIEFTENDIFIHNEMWHCFEVHSVLSDTSSELMLEKLNKILHNFRSQLEEASQIVITYGTSWVYRNKTSNEIVANCHKVPQNQFDKVILSVETIEASIQKTIDLIQKINPKCNFIFTISPVRHIKDGFVENQRSKAHLIAALHNILKVSPSEAEWTYFPSFEIMMDELRDYRFYAEDMLHPNQVAIDYIWEQFIKSQIAHEIHPVMQEVNTIQKGLAHRPFHPNTESHQKFLKKLQQKMVQLQQQLPFLKFS